ncbi:hypothetical protein Tco_1388050 [Tanacetum coccineum]
MNTSFCQNHHRRVAATQQQCIISMQPQVQRHRQWLPDNQESPTIPNCTCGDGYVYETKYPDSSSASTLTGNQKNSLSYHGEPSVPKKQSSTLTVRNTQDSYPCTTNHMHGPVMYAIATEQITTSAGNIHSPSLNSNKPPARAHANERDLTTDYGNNVNGNIVGANRDTRHHRYRVTKSQLSAIPNRFGVGGLSDK